MTMRKEKAEKRKMSENWHRQLDPALVCIAENEYLIIDGKADFGRSV
jgi:hypothetical protein